MASVYDKDTPDLPKSKKEYVDPAASIAKSSAGIKAPVTPAEAKEYGTARIYDRQGNLVNVYSEGPNAGRAVDTGELVLQGEAPAGAIEGVVGSGNPIIPAGGGGATLPAITGGSTPGVTSNAGYAGKVSAFNILKDEFSKYGLGSLVDGIKNLLTDGTPASEFSLRLRETPEYKARFAANEARIAAGLSALSPAEYVAVEDQYQNVMRNYGLPASYYTKDTMGKQAGFEKFLANDVSAAELEDRIATAQQRVLNSNPEVLQALKQFYPDISNADILAYTLDPKNALTNIKRKVTAAEIGGAALAQGLQALGGTAESLAGQGITKAQAQAGYADVAQLAPRGGELAAIYGESPYTQQTAEAEVFNTTGAAEAAKKRKKLTELEKASFSGSSGVGALSRDRATNYGTTQSGFGAY